MMWGQPFMPYIDIPNEDIEVPEGTLGVCQECFCAGTSAHCWFCDKVTERKRTFTTGNGHRHDPSTKAVSLGSAGIVPVEGNLHYCREEVECTPSSAGAS